MPVTAVRTALSAGHARPSRSKVCVQSAHWYAFFRDAFGLDATLLRQKGTAVRSGHGFRDPHDRREPCLLHIRPATHPTITNQTSPHYARPCGLGKCRSVGFTGCDPQASHAIPPHCATGAAHPSPRPADQLAELLALPGTERINLVAVEQHRERWASPVDQTAVASACSRATAHCTRSRRQMGRWDDVVDRVRCARGK
jgi:hypothetical protein